MSIVIESKIVVELNSTILIKILKEVSDQLPLETGGILMGAKFLNRIQVLDYIGPGPKGIHRRSSFIPDYDFHETEVSRIFGDSNGLITYLGDWHSHPNSSSYLSDLDKSTIRKISSYEPSNLPDPLMMILGTLPFEMKCWRYRKTKTFKKGSFVELKIELAT